MRLTMQPTPMCEFESAVTAAARSGNWTPELTAHRSSCAACADAALVAEYLAQEISDESVVVPEAGLIWWRSQVRAKLDATDKALEPVRWAERAAMAIFVLGAAYVATVVPGGSGATTAVLMLSLLLALAAAGSVVYFVGARK